MGRRSTHLAKSRARSSLPKSETSEPERGRPAVRNTANRGIVDMTTLRPLDLSNILRHAFLSGFDAARSGPGVQDGDGPAYWVGYVPCDGSYERVVAALSATPQGGLPEHADATQNPLSEGRERS